MLLVKPAAGTFTVPDRFCYPDSFPLTGWWLYCGVRLGFSLLSLCCFAAKPLQGHWSCWSEFSECSVTCGAGGTKLRTRTCVREPGSGTESGVCEGQSTELAPCDAPPCPTPRKYALFGQSVHSILLISLNTSNSVKSISSLQSLKGSRKSSRRAYVSNIGITSRPNNPEPTTRDSTCAGQ